MSPTCTVVREGKEKEVLVRGIVPGDIAILETGDRVPADLRVLESVNIQVDEAPLTGQSPFSVLNVESSQSKVQEDSF